MTKSRGIGHGGARKGSGRKPREESALRPLLQVKISPERYAAFREWCAEHGMTVADAVNGLVEDCLRRGNKKST